MRKKNESRIQPMDNAFALPVVVTQENKHLQFVIFGLVGLLLYVTSNHYHITPPRLLPMSWLDQGVPFLPHTVWIYLSEYVFFGAVYFTCQEIMNLNKYIYSVMTLQVVSVLIFWIWPTTYPRELFPLPQDLDPLTYFAFDTLRQADTSANCCPSLHVSSVYLSSFIFLDDQRKKFPFFFFWGTLIALSTLTTKQHYLVDVVTGFLLAGAFYWIFHKFFVYLPKEQYAQHRLRLSQKAQAKR